MRVDRSGPLREGKRVALPPITPIVDLPALAVIIRYMSKRPEWMAREPFAAPLDLYEAGEAEMKAHMQKRGFALPVSKELERDKVRNFMVLGTPIVIDANG